MAAGSYDLNIEQGSTFEQEFIWQDTQTPPQPIDLTGYTARLQIRTSYEAATPEIELTTANGRITLGGLLGTITLLLTDDETAALDWPSPAVYDLELESASGRVTRLLKGKATLDPEVTR